MTWRWWERLGRLPAVALLLSSTQGLRAVAPAATVPRRAASHRVLSRVQARASSRFTPPRFECGGEITAFINFISHLKCTFLY